MQVLINIGIVVITVIGMEAVAWGLHKYILHTFLWPVHEDHHRHTEGRFEKNDLVSLIFAIPSWLLMMFGIMYGIWAMMYVGIGIAIYGLFYFLFHDGLIHGRIKIFSNPKTVYLLGCKIGHLAHHQHDHKPDYNKDNDVAWGMLWVPRKYFKQAREHLEKKRKESRTKSTS